MFWNKMHIVIAIFLAISGSILTWFVLYGDFPHNSPIRAMQVFNSGHKTDTSPSSSNFLSKYNTANNVQTINEVRSFN